LHPHPAIEDVFPGHSCMIKITQTDQDAALRRAIIRISPNYYSWPQTRQEQFRLRMSREDEFAIRQAVIQALFGYEVGTEEAMEALLDSFDDNQYLLLNSTMLPLQGIGEDKFFLNECLPSEKTLIDFETLGDYARDDHQFQEKARKQDNPEHTTRSYRGDLHRCWARLHVDGVFYYADLSSQAGYIVDILDELGFDKINSLIPHDYVDGVHHGKREGKGFIYDKRVNANGLEGQLEELKHRYYAHMKECYEDLLTLFDRMARNCVYMRDRSHRQEPHMDFVFSDKTALDSVRFRHFISDCRLITDDDSELESQIQQENRTALEFLAESYRDIMENFDSTVVPLRKKRKIILTDSRLKDLL